MKCDDTKLLFMDFIYNEISDEDEQVLQNHLSGCVSCREEFQSLKQTSGILRKWEDVDPKLNLIFVSDKKSIFGAFMDKFSFAPKKLAFGFALGFASIILFFSIANTELSFKDGDFSMKMGLFKTRTEQAQLSPEVQQALLNQLQQQNAQMISEMIRQSEQRQRQELAATLTKFSREFNYQRTNDLKLMGAGLDEIEQKLYQQMEKQTNDRFNNLIRYINQNQGANRK
ncbi:hypothetical protein GF337_05985 [candidate division KSB1 bacterium]|nr:hypothetical protein [candidate division KSB1 bacterium]